jgi:hypothetical protein
VQQELPSLEVGRLRPLEVSSDRIIHIAGQPLDLRGLHAVLESRTPPVRQ